MLKHPTSRNQRRMIKKLRNKFDPTDRIGHVNKVLLEEKEIIDELREQSKKEVQGTDT